MGRGSFPASPPSWTAFLHEIRPNSFWDSCPLGSACGTSIGYPPSPFLTKGGGGSAHFPQIKVQQIALERWDTALFHNSWITPVHIAGEDNQLTDYLSCHKMGQADYGLRKEVHSRVCSSFFTPSFDLFFLSGITCCDPWSSSTSLLLREEMPSCNNNGRNAATSSPHLSFLIKTTAELAHQDISASTLPPDLDGLFSRV